jgi:hypothetical protein
MLISCADNQFLILIIVYLNPPVKPIMIMSKIKIKKGL